MSNEGRENNSNWDGIWDVRTRITETGWYRGDLDSVPHAEVPRRRSADVGPELRAQAAAAERRQLLVAAAAHLQPRARVAGRHDRRAARPAARQEHPRSSRTRRRSSSTSAPAGPDGDFDAGFDVKYGVTSGLTWDFTVNTDFSQVEADEQQVNLSRFSLFFPEKRDFFLENSGIFQFGAPSMGGGGGGAAGRDGRTRRRTCGCSSAAASGCRMTGAAIPILAGTRLTGRVGPVLGRRARTSSSARSTARRRPTSRRCACSATSSPTPTSASCSSTRRRAGSHYNRVAGLDANFRFGDLEPERVRRRRRFRRRKRCRRQRRGLRGPRGSVNYSRAGCSCAAITTHRRAVPRRDGLRAASRRRQRAPVRPHELPSDVGLEDSASAKSGRTGRSTGSGAATASGLESRYQDCAPAVQLQRRRLSSRSA